MLMLMAGLFAQATTKTQQPAKPVRRSPAITAIPKDAVETSPGFFRWTDKDGKAWTYRRTPFGISRWPADAIDIQKEAVAKQNSVKERTVAVDKGDSVQFEEATPFGKRTWIRKKSELSDTEQTIWDAQQKSSTADRAKEKE
jgi:hypothetical protein